MKTYPSALEKWVVAILIAVPLCPLVLGIVIAFTFKVEAGLTIIITAAVAGTLIALFTIPRYYTLDDEKLTIRSGIIRDKVPLARIRRVKNTNALYSSPPALYIRRVEVITNERIYLISPKDRDAFIADLRARITP